MYSSEVMKTMKTLIPVFTCGYCGNMDVKQGDARCSACGGRFDWENSTVEESPLEVLKSHEQVLPSAGGKAKTVGPVKKVEAQGSKAEFLNVPTWSAESVTGKPPGKSSCQEAATPFTEQQRMDDLKRQQQRQKYAVAIRNLYKTARIVIIGVASPFDMMKIEKYRKEHPNTTSMYSTRLIWMYAEGNDASVHQSWIWSKDRAEIEKYASLSFKVILADVDEVTSKDGTVHYNVARHVTKVEKTLSPCEAEKVVGSVPSKFKVKSVDDIEGMEKDPDVRNFCTVEGLVLWKRLFESGNVLNILPESEGFDAKALRVMVPKMIDIDDVSEGDVVTITGDWYLRRKFDNEAKRLSEEREPSMSALGIVPIDKVCKADAEYLAGFR